MTMHRIVPPYTQTLLDTTDLTPNLATVSESLDLGTLPLRLSVQFVVTASAAVKTFANTAVDNPADTITIPSHGLSTGLRVTYAVLTGTTITGLVDTTNYYVIKVDANTIALATNLAGAQAGTKIAIASGGAGTFSVTPQTPAGTVKVLGSNDDSNYTELSSDSFTGTSSFIQQHPTVSFRYVKLTVNVTAGEIDCLGITHTKL